MKNTARCPKCGSHNLVRVPDDAHRYPGNSISITKVAWVTLVPVARYVCCDCGYVEDWVETQKDLETLRREYSR